VTMGSGHDGSAASYAACLARLFDLCLNRRRVLLASGMASGRSQLGERIEGLLRGPRDSLDRRRWCA